jgi:hypothetical protein
VLWGNAAFLNPPNSLTAVLRYVTKTLLLNIFYVRSVSVTWWRTFAAIGALTIDGKFVTLFLRTGHWLLSTTRWTHSTPSSYLWSVLILSAHLRIGLPSALLPISYGFLEEIGFEFGRGGTCWG